MNEEKMESALREAEATLNIEGQYLTEEMKELIRKKARGEISREEFQKKALEIALNE
ncbi:antitoxin VbhA family protein [Paenibacillus dendritiformis]|uniref:antitoxin VbhA family protein n=1 Tax=Paenibacillus dendritiformis TaxID=130049 RepID=UPI0018CD30AB|nr:antitoxin VbhA family protein [Paenibacillus dendritiformis]